MRPWHLNISSVSRLALFPGPDPTRRAVWKLCDLCGRTLALFCIVDDHLHAVVVCEEPALQRLVRAMTLSVRALAAVEVNPTHVQPIVDRRHMLNVFDYVLRQPAKHELPVHPALWQGSCLPDLVGARVIPGLQLRIMEALPRATQADALAAVGLPARRLDPIDLDTVRTLGPARLLSAAAAAAAAPPELRGRLACEANARRAACCIAKAAGLPLSEIAWQLDITRRAARRLATHPGLPGLEHATLRRLALGLRVAAARRS